MQQERFRHYRTGYPVIDDEHFHLFQLMDVTLQLIKAHPIDCDAVKESLHVIEVALLAHLTHEEQLMDESKYRYAAAHKAGHDDLRLRMGKLLNTQECDVRHMDYVIHELEYILLSHVDSYDMQIRLFPPAVAGPV